MESTKYIRSAILVFCSLLALMVATCLLLDPYGLVRSRSQGILVYANEGTAKYLLAQSYVPKNFDGILLGGCGSVHLNTKLLRHARIYNASLNGINLSDSIAIGRNAIQHGVSLVLLDLSGSSFFYRINPKHTLSMRTRFSAYGSLAVALEVLFPLLGKVPLFTSEGNLFSPPAEEDYLDSLQGRQRDLQKELKLGNRFPLDPKTFNDLKEFFDLAKVKGIKTIAYSLPLPRAIQSLDNERLRELNVRRNKAVGDLALFDFNETMLWSEDSERHYFRSVDFLNDRGGEAVLNRLDSLLHNLHNLTKLD